MYTERWRHFYRENRWMVLTAAVVFLAMLPLNFLTPMVGDDFAYCYSFFDGERIGSLWDVIKSQYAHYQTMNGRAVLHFIAQVSLWLPHGIFKMANSAMYMLLGILIYQHAVYGDSQKHPLLLVLIYAAMWVWIPLFGETVLWQDGSCNYLWGTVLVLLFLLPYRMYASDGRVFQKKRWIPIMAVLGVLAGACNENTSGAACMAAVLFLMRYGLQKKKIPVWAWVSLLGAVIGFGVMILAPGNLSRAAGMIAGSEDSFLYVNSARDAFVKFMWISRQIGDLAGIWLVFLTIFLGAYLVFAGHSFRKMEMPVIYLLCLLASMYAMLIPPTFPERAKFGPMIFWIIGLAGMLVHLEIRRDMAVTMALLTCLLSLNGVQYLDALKQNVLLNVKLRQREAYVQQQKEEGSLDLEFSYLPSYGPYSAWTDMTADPDYFYNARYAQYHGLHSVVVPDAPSSEE